MTVARDEEREFYLFVWPRLLNRAAVSAGARNVGMELWNCSDRATASTWVAQETIAETLGVSVRSVRRWMDELEAAGLVEVVKTYGGRLGRGSDTKRLAGYGMPPRVMEATAAWQERIGAGPGPGIYRTDESGSSGAGVHDGTTYRTYESGRSGAGVHGGADLPDTAVRPTGQDGQTYRTQLSDLPDTGVRLSEQGSDQEQMSYHVGVAASPAVVVGEAVGCAAAARAEDVEDVEEQGEDVEPVDVEVLEVEPVEVAPESVRDVRALDPAEVVAAALADRGLEPMTGGELADVRAWARRVPRAGFLLGRVLTARGVVEEREGMPA